MYFRERAMKKLFLQILFIFSMFVCCPPTVAAQNLYINSLDVFFVPGTTDQHAYCNYSSTKDVTNVKSVSMLTGGGQDPWDYSAKIEFAKPIKNTTHAPRITTLDGYNQNTSGAYIYPNHCLLLCAAVQCASSTAPIAFGVDEMNFEIFKYY